MKDILREIDAILQKGGGSGKPWKERRSEDAVSLREIYTEFDPDDSLVADYLYPNDALFIVTLVNAWPQLRARLVAAEAQRDALATLAWRFEDFVGHDDGRVHFWARQFEQALAGEREKGGGG